MSIIVYVTDFMLTINDTTYIYILCLNVLYKCIRKRFIYLHILLVITLHDHNIVYHVNR